MSSNLSRNFKNDLIKIGSVLFLTSTVIKDLSSLALRIQILLLVRKTEGLVL
jgi:hypothetical protein